MLAKLSLLTQSTDRCLTYHVSCLACFCLSYYCHWTDTPLKYPYSTQVCSGTCSAGYYCSSGSSSATQAACLAGHYCPSASSSATHATCSGGYYCPSASSSATQTACSAGFFCSAGSSADKQGGACSAGFFCPSASSSATQDVCSAGYYCPSASSSAMQIACAAGFYCPTGSSSDKQGGACSAGFYCPSASSSATQAACSAGYYCNAGASADKQGGMCSAGYFCPSASSSATQIACSAGYTCPVGSLSDKQGGVCGMGTYCPPGSSSALPCPPGSFSSDVAEAQCTPCAPGTSSPLTGQSVVCPQCPAGTYAATSGLAECQPCPSGQITTTVGQTTCVYTDSHTIVYAVVAAVLSGMVAMLFWFVRMRREARLRRDQFGIASQISQELECADALGDFSGEDGVSFVAGVRAIESNLESNGGDAKALTFDTAAMNSTKIRALAKLIAEAMRNNCPPELRTRCPSEDCCFKSLFTENALPYETIVDYAEIIASEVRTASASSKILCAVDKDHGVHKRKSSGEAAVELTDDNDMSVSLLSAGPSDNVMVMLKPMSGVRSHTVRAESSAE
jgi:hypothetical protein